MDEVLRDYDNDMAWRSKVTFLLQQPLPFDWFIGGVSDIGERGYIGEFALLYFEMSRQEWHSFLVGGIPFVKLQLLLNKQITPQSEFKFVLDCNEKPQWRGHYYLDCHRRLIAEKCHCQLRSLFPLFDTCFLLFNLCFGNDIR